MKPTRLPRFAPKTIGTPVPPNAADVAMEIDSSLTWVREGAMFLGLRGRRAVITVGPNGKRPSFNAGVSDDGFSVLSHKIEHDSEEAAKRAAVLALAKHLVELRKPVEVKTFTSIITGKPVDSAEDKAALRVGVDMGGIDVTANFTKPAPWVPKVGDRVRLNAKGLTHSWADTYHGDMVVVGDPYGGNLVCGGKVLCDHPTGGRGDFCLSDLKPVEAAPTFAWDDHGDAIIGAFKLTACADGSWSVRRRGREDAPVAEGIIPSCVPYDVMASRTERKRAEAKAAAEAAYLAATKKAAFEWIDGFGETHVRNPTNPTASRAAVDHLSTARGYRWSVWADKVDRSAGFGWKETGFHEGVSPTIEQAMRDAEAFWLSNL